MFKFYLDNTLVTEPINWKDFTEVIEHDINIKGILPKYDNKLNFTGSGYEFIYNKYFDFGFCKLIELRVEMDCESGNFTTIFNGYIFVSDCRFNLNRCIVECSVTDNSYGAKIFNNKSIKTPLKGDKSKNGATITPATYENITPFRPDTGANLGFTFKAYSVHEAFKYLISFLSDDSIGFESDYLLNYSEEIGYLTTGLELRTQVFDSPILSFEVLFKEVNKAYPISFTVVDRSGVPTIKIENDDYFYNLTNSIQLDNIDNLLQSFDNELLYSSVRFGSNTIQYNPSIHTLIPRQFVYFQDEEYFFAGQCNIDKKLDLYSDFIVDSNIIEELVYTNTTNETWDKDIFFIEIYTLSGSKYAAKTSISGGGYYYNFTHTNKSIASRNKFAGDLTLFLNLDSSGFIATRTDYVESPRSATNGHDNADFRQGDIMGVPTPTLQTSSYITTIFNDDSTPPNVNTGGNYNNSNGKYTVPVTGFYYFRNYTIIRVFPYLTGDSVGSQSGILGGINREWRVNIKFMRYNASNVLQSESEFNYPNSVGFYIDRGEGIYGFMSADYFECTATDYVVVKVQFESQAINSLFGSAIAANVSNGSEFRTIATTSGGGVYAVGDSGIYFNSKLEFQLPISNDTYNEMKSDLSNSLIVNHDGHSDKKAWIRKTSRVLYNGDTKFELISNYNNAR